VLCFHCRVLVCSAGQVCVTALNESFSDCTVEDFQASFIIQLCLECQLHTEKYTCHSRCKESYQTLNYSFFLSFFLPLCHLSSLSLSLVKIPQWGTSCFSFFHKSFGEWNTDMKTALFAPLRMCCFRETGVNSNAVFFFFIYK